MLKTVLLFFSSIIFSVKADTITIVGDENYLPIIGVENNSPSGILIDKLKSIEKNSKQRLKFSYDLYPWARALNLSSTTNVGIIGISFNKEREQLYDFSLPIYIDSILLVVRKDNVFKYNNFSDLIGKSIGAQLNASFGEKFDSFVKHNNLNIIRDVDRVSRLQKVLYNRIDIALIGNGIEGYRKLIESNADLRKNKHMFVVLPKPLTMDKLYLAFNKTLNKKETLKLINESFLKSKF